MAEPIGWVEVERASAGSVARIIGDVDVSNVDDVRRALERAFDHDFDRCIVDLSATTYFDSCGIRLLFQLAQRLQMRRQDLQIVVPERTVTRRALELTDVQRVVPLLPSLDEARARD